MQEVLQYSGQDWLDAVGSTSENIKSHIIFDDIIGASFPHPDLVQWKGEIHPMRTVERLAGLYLQNQSLDPLDVQSSKDLLFYALEHGVEHLKWSISDLNHLSNIPLVFQGVHLDMIQLSIPLSSGLNSDQHKNYIQEFIKLKGPVAFEFDQHTDFDLLQMQTLFHENANIKFNFIHSIQLNNFSNWSNKLLDSIKLFFQNNKYLLQVQYIIRLQLSKDFLSNVAMLRALRFLIAHEKWERVFIETEVNLHDLSDDPFHNQIHQSMCSLSAMLGGADTIWLSPNDLNEKHFTKQWLRTVLHTIHILKKESYLDLVNDPLKGSYYVEDLSQQFFYKLKSTQSHP
ncbi:MAG: hypothetical protein IPO62_12120 [Saprospiraceae bacterium]|nr:hypothetical protein [Saprospiraceae bacterium]